MGRVKTRKVKVLAKEIMEKFPDRISADFELNKMLVGEVLAGQVSGYITRLAKRELEKAEEEAVAEAG